MTFEKRVLNGKCCIPANFGKANHRRPCPGRGAAFFMPLRRAGTVPNTEPSWPGLSRPSMSLPQRKQDVDARDKAGHDERVVLVTAPALQRTVPQELHAALRPGEQGEV